MRRRTRRAITNIALFTAALLLILYLNREHSTANSYAWTTVRYRTSAATLPKVRGICPGLGSTSKPALVVSRVEADGDFAWVEALGATYHICSYTVDVSDARSAVLQVPRNHGHEAMTYLTYIIDNYAELPSASVFVHGSRFAWHNDAPDYDNAALLATLNVTAALDPLGYHNLRCDWSTSTCSAKSSPPQGSLEITMNAMMEPWNARVVSDATLPRVLVALFGGAKSAKVLAESLDEGRTLPEISSKDGLRLSLARTDAVRAQCCAQFVVSRERILQHTREEYVAIRQWLLDTKPGTREHKHPGRLLSYVWHILFMPRDEVATTSSNSQLGIDLEKLNKLSCPTAKDCYCKLYGRCDLDSCSPGRCRGQYTLPPNLKLPADWADTHS